MAWSLAEARKRKRPPRDDGLRLFELSANRRGAMPPRAGSVTLQQPVAPWRKEKPND
jgi:hypothetical protein